MFNVKELKSRIDYAIDRIIDLEVDRRNLMLYQAFYKNGGIEKVERQNFFLNFDSSARLLGGSALVDVYLNESKVFSVKVFVRIPLASKNIDHAELTTSLKVIEPHKAIGPVIIDNHIFEITEN